MFRIFLYILSPSLPLRTPFEVVGEILVNLFNQFAYGVEWHHFFPYRHDVLEVFKCRMVTISPTCTRWDVEGAFVEIYFVKSVFMYSIILNILMVYVNALKGFTPTESPISNCRHTLRDVNALKGFTVAKGAFPNYRYTIGNFEFFYFLSQWHPNNCTFILAKQNSIYG